MVQAIAAKSQVKTVELRFYDCGNLQMHKIPPVPNCTSWQFFLNFWLNVSNTSITAYNSSLTASRKCVWMYFHTGELLHYLMKGHYILVSSASAPWVWSTAALGPQTLSELDPKGFNFSPTHPSLLLLDLCLHPTVTSSSSLWALCPAVFLPPGTCSAVFWRTVVC